MPLKLRPIRLNSVTVISVNYYITCDDSYLLNKSIKIFRTVLRNFKRFYRTLKISRIFKDLKRF